MSSRVLWVACLLGNVAAVTMPWPASAEPQASNLLKKLAQKLSSSKEYSYEGKLDMGRKENEASLDIRTRVSVKLVTAPGGRYHFSAKGDKTLPDREVVSNGSTKWTFVPASSQYTEQPNASAGAKPGLLNLEDPQQFCTQLFAAFQNLPAMAQTTFFRGSVLTVLSKQDTQGRQTLVYVTLNPETLAVSRITWMQAVQNGPKKVIDRADLQFSTVQMDVKSPADEFVFHPPDGSVAVPALP